MTIRCLVRVYQASASQDPIDFVLVDVRLETTGASDEASLVRKALMMTGGFYGHVVER